MGTSSVEQSEEIYQALIDLGLQQQQLNILNARPENIERYVVVIIITVDVIVLLL